MPNRPATIAGFSVWSATDGAVEVRFIGRGSDRTRRDVLAAVDGSAPPVAWSRQVHSARSVAIERPGEHGRADALVCSRADLALSVATADCVPILLATESHLAAVHAGWRGIADGVVASCLARLPSVTDARAWIGPAVGSCCYEVGTDVATRVAASSSEAVVVSDDGRPRLDLVAAVRHQLAAGGIDDHRVIAACTGCRSRWLWSYRRDGAGAGRNLAFIWRR